MILKSSWRVVFYVWWEIELLLGDWKITTVLRELTVEVKVVLAKRRVCAVEWTSCCFMDTVSTVSIVFQIRVRKEKNTRKSWLSKSWRRVSALRWLVHSLEADCWSKIYLIVRKLSLGPLGVLVCFHKKGNIEQVFSYVVLWEYFIVGTICLATCEEMKNDES